MRWNNTILSDNTNIRVESFTIGNGYWVGAYVAHSDEAYTIEILYSQDGSKVWRSQQLKATALKPTIGDVVFTSEGFAIAYTILNSNKVSILHAPNPSDNWENIDNVYTAQGEIDINETAVLNGKICIAGAATVDNITSGLLLVGDSLTGEYENKVNLAGSRLERYSVFATVYTGRQYCAFVTRHTNLATKNDYQIYSSEDLEIWPEPVTVATDNLNAPPFPAFAYCTDYSALALFLHGNIYVSKAGQAFVTIPYPGGIGVESVRAATSDGTKFLASSASNNQDDLKVIYSIGDPTVATNWRVQTLAPGTQISSDVKFAAASSLFAVVSGGVNTPPTLYTALFPANELNIMKDRVPTYPGRVSLTPLGDNLYTLAREDDPTEEGTKLSKVNLLSDDAALAVWNNTPPNILCTPSTALEHLGNNAFHVGDILTTARDLSTDENWLKCTGGGISEVDYPELYPLLQTGSVEGDWNTNVIDSSTPYVNGSNCDVATDGEWYVMVTIKPNSNNTFDWYAYCTNDPSGAWTKKTIVTGSNWSSSGDSVYLIYANGYFAFMVTEFTQGTGYGNSFVVYADDPSGAWNTMQIGVAGRVYPNFKYVNGKYLTFANYTTPNYCTDVLTFDNIGGQVTTTTIMSNMGTATWTRDIDYYDGKWYAIWHQGYTSGSFYVTNTRLYHSDTLATVYSAGQYGQVEYASSSSGNPNYFFPENLTCGNGYYVLWGYRSVGQGQNGLLDIYYSNDLNTFIRMSMPQYGGFERERSIPIFFDGAFYITLRGFSDSKPYILYGADPTNFNAKLLFNGNVYRTRLAAADASKTLFVGTQSQDYTTLTAAWQKVGKSLPRISPGVGLNAYIKAKEGN